MRPLKTNSGEIANDQDLGKIMLFAANAKDALKIVKLFMKSGYTVATGPMNSYYKGVRVYVWFKEKKHDE